MTAAADELRMEMKDIMENDKNPYYKGYLCKDPTVMRYIERRYAEVHGTGKVDLEKGAPAAELLE